MRARIDRTNDFGQAGDTYRKFSDAERDELIMNLVDTLKPSKQHIQQRMVWLFSQCDAGYGSRVTEGWGLSVPTSDPDGRQGHRFRRDGYRPLALGATVALECGCELTIPDVP